MLVNEKETIKGRWKVQIERQGKIIFEEEINNTVTNLAKNSLWNVYFRSTSQITTWYSGLIDNASFSAVAAADTMSSHTGWIEFTGYSEANRQSWGPDAAASQAISNSTPFQFTMNTSGTLKGLFITSDNTKSGTSGTLWSAATFSSTQAVLNGDVVKLVYTVSA